MAFRWKGSPSTPISEAVLTLTLTAEEHSLADVAFVIESLDNLPMSCLKAAMRDRTAEVAQRVSRLVLQTMDRNDEDFVRLVYDDLSFGLRPPVDLYRFGGRSQMAYRTAINALIKRILFEADPELYRESLSFASVRRIEQRSPIVVEIATVISVGVGLPAVLLSMCMWLLHIGRRSEAKTQILESQAEQQRLVTRQMEATVKLRELLADRVWERFTGVKPPEISDEVLQTLVAQITPTVAELHDSPFIGDITFGLSSKKDYPLEYFRRVFFIKLLGHMFQGRKVMVNKKCENIATLGVERAGGVAIEVFLKLTNRIRNLL